MNSLAMLISSLGLASLTLCPCCSTRASAEAPSAQATPSATSVTLEVEGMTCASCAFTVRAALKKLDGVKDAKVSKAANQAVVDFDPAKVTPRQMVDAIDKAGYRGSLPAPAGS